MRKILAVLVTATLLLPVVAGAWDTKKTHPGAKATADECERYPSLEMLLASAYLLGITEALNDPAKARKTQRETVIALAAEAAVRAQSCGKCHRGGSDSPPPDKAPESEESPKQPPPIRASPIIPSRKK